MIWKLRHAKALFAIAGIGLLAIWSLATSPRLSAANYNRNAAEQYADLWTCNDCVEPHNDFYRYYAGADCTNYASQVLHAGGYPYREGADDIWHWWFTQFPWKRNSSTWSNTPAMNQYFAQYQANEFEYRGWPNQLEKGDIFLFDFPPTDNVADHAAVIVGTPGGLKDQHTPPRKRVAWNLNEDPGTAYWSIHVKW